nr:type II CRISPR RNA-guided endonuclease Cas9 [Hyphobacterium indicum]
MERLVAFGLMPKDESKRKELEHLDPWILRCRALDEPLTAHEIGRALFHLQQRRGFKSNRKADRGDSDKGAIAEARERTLDRLANEGARTLGELFGRRRMDAAQNNAVTSKGARQPQPAARVSPYQDGAKLAYDYYPTRELIQQEFDLIWESQVSFQGKDTLTDDARNALADTLLYQRKLKPQPVGKCSLDPTQTRAERALPSIQRLRIYQDANHLHVLVTGEPSRSLTLEERDIVVDRLLGSARVSFSGLRKALKLPADSRFNLESEKRSFLLGDETAAELAKEKRWGKEWRKMLFADQERIVRQLLDVEEEEELRRWLTDEFGLGATEANAVSDASLPEGHAAICSDAAGRLLTALQGAVITYDKAVIEAGFLSHSRLDHHGEILDRLPYYGKVLQRHVAFGSGEPSDKAEKRYGKVANPTVHVALNQIRHVVNDLVRRIGSPEEIVIELARDLPLSAQGKRDLEKRQRENQNANEKRREDLRKLGRSDTYENRMRLRLWEELNPENVLDRKCPFTGEQIGIERLFSDEVEIEHILPKSRTLDDSPANKTLCMRSANREKRERSPYEAFGSSPGSYSWGHIVARAANMPSNKSWRFAPDAMDRFESEERDFLDRQLSSTQYIARLTANYLVWLVGDPGKVHVTPGRLTSDLRHHWGLNSVLRGHNEAEPEAIGQKKNRNDHRHHAIDAIVVALTDRGLLKKIATQAARNQSNSSGQLIDTIDTPWASFRDDVAACLSSIIVSHKADHGVQGALHNDTAYGLASDADKTGKRDVVHRVPVASLDTLKKIEQVRDPLIRDAFMDAAAGLTGKDVVTAVVTAGEAMTPPVRKVRVLERMNVIPINDKDGQTYKAYKGDGNYCYDIYANEKGGWTGEVVSRFDANQPSFEANGSISRSGTPLIMRIRGGDTLLIDQGQGERFMRVVKFSSGMICLAEHFEAGSLKARDTDQHDDFKYLIVAPSRLQNWGAQIVHVSPSGHVFR